VALPDPERSRVVLIGTSRFNHPDLADLPAVEANIAGLAACLTNPEFWGVRKEHCQEVLDPNSLVSLVEPIHNAALEAEDTLLIYYAGHGLVHSDRLDLLLALTGSDPGRPYTAVHYDQVRDNVLLSPAKRKIVILDCCFSGRALGGQGDPADVVASETAIQGTYLLTSARPNKQSLSPPGETYTAFTGALLNVLKKGIQGEGEYLRLRSVYRSVRLALKGAGRPEPQLRVDNNVDELALVRNARFLDREWEHLPAKPDDQPASGRTQVHGEEKPQRRPGMPIATRPHGDDAAFSGLAEYLTDAPQLKLSPRQSPTDDCTDLDSRLIARSRSVPEAPESAISASSAGRPLQDQTSSKPSARVEYERIVIEPLGIVDEVAEILRPKPTKPKLVRRPTVRCDTDADSEFPAWDSLLGPQASPSATRPLTRRPTEEASSRPRPTTIAENNETLRRERESRVAEPSTRNPDPPPAVFERPLLHVISATGSHQLRIAPAEFPDGHPARLRVVSWEQPMLETFPSDRVLLTVRRPDGVHVRLRAPVGGVLLDYSGSVLEHGVVATFRPSPLSGARPVTSGRRDIGRQILRLGFAAHAAVRRQLGLFWSPSTPGKVKPHVVMLPGGVSPGAFIAEGDFVAAVLLNGSETVELLSPIAGRLVESRHRPGAPLGEDELVALIDIDDGTNLGRQLQPV
jgi:hypothetical protein